MPARFLLDTHAAVWLLEGSPTMGHAARAALDDAEMVAISDISLLEIALLEARGILSLRPNAAAGLKE